jgi:hypothetical protein
LIVGEATQIKPNENQVMVGDKVVDLYHPNPKIEPPNQKIPIKILKNHPIQVLHP